MKKLIVLAIAATSMALSAQAGLLGTNVTGQLTFTGNPNNYFDSSKGFVPSGYGNSGGSTTVAIANPLTEFGYFDTVNRITADFTDTGLTVQFISSGGATGSTLVFTDSAFTGLTLFKASDTFPNAVTGGLVGNTLTINVPTFSSSGTFAATFSLTSSTTPEPSSAAAMMTGLGLLAILARRRLRA